MALDLTTLADFTNQNSLNLLTKSIFGGRTVSMLRAQPGIKSSSNLNIMDTTATFQEGGICAFNDSGVTNFSQRMLEVGKITVMEEICISDLEGHFLENQLPQGSNYNSLPFEEVWTNMKSALIAKQLEIAIWQGDKDSVNDNLKRFDGFLKIIDAASGVLHPDSNGSGAITLSNVRTIFGDMYNAIPAEILNSEDLRCFCGWDAFRTLLNKLTTDNLYHYKTDDAAMEGMLFYPGTTMRIVAVHGLNGTHRVVAGRLSNMFFGTDLMGEEDHFKIVPMIDLSNTIRLRVDFKAGVQIAFPEEIITYLPA